MDYFVFAVVAAVVAYYMFFRKNKNPGGYNAGNAPPQRQSPATSSDSDRQLVSNKSQIDYLKAQWTAAEKQRNSGQASTFPEWFFDPVTERQLKRLKSDGTEISGEAVTKGAASDLIGLREPIEEEDSDILKFFKLSTKGMNQTIGRYEAKRLLSNLENEAAWKARPAEPMQKEYLKFFGLPAPKGLTASEAQKLIAGHTEEAEGWDEKKAAEWEAFESIVNNLADPETREDYNIKKPSLTAIREAMAVLRATGQDADDIQAVVDQLIEMKPELERGS